MGPRGNYNQNQFEWLKSCTHDFAYYCCARTIRTCVYGLVIKVSLLVRRSDFRSLNVCTLIQMGQWTSVLIIKVSLLVRCLMCVQYYHGPDYQGVLISEF